MTIWTAIAAIGTLLILLSGGIWAFVSFRSDIAVNAEALKGLGEKHNTSAARVGEDLKRLESYIDTRIINKGPSAIASWSLGLPAPLGHYDAWEKPWSRRRWVKSTGATGREAAHDGR